MANRNSADTPVLMTPPTPLNCSKRVESSGRRRGDAGRGQHDHGRMAQGEEEAHGDGPLAVLHQLAGDVVDGGDVVGVHGVAQAEAVGEQGRAQEQRLIAEHQEGPGPRGQVGRDEQAVDADERAAQAAGAFVEGSGEQGQHGHLQAARAPRPAALACATTAGLLARGSTPLALPSQTHAGSSGPPLKQGRTDQRLAADSCGGSRRLAPGPQSSQGARRSLFTRSRGTVDPGCLEDWPALGKPRTTCSPCQGPSQQYPLPCLGRMIKYDLGP